MAAFECLYKVAHVFSQNARLWLRLAECCIMVFRHSLSSSGPENQTGFIPSNLTTSANEKMAKLSEKIKCISRSFGHSYYHKIQLGSCLANDRSSLGYSEYLTLNDLLLATEKKEDEKEQERLNKMITLDFAYMCLKNALNLLPSNQRMFAPKNKSSNSESSSSGAAILSQIKSSKLNEDTAADSASNSSAKDEEAGLDDANESIGTDEQGSDLSPNRFTNQHLSINKQQAQILDNRLFNCVWPSKPINLVELQNLRSSILVAIGYVSLSLKDYMNTAKYCKILLDSDDPLNSKCPVSKGNR